MGREVVSERRMRVEVKMRKIERVIIEFWI